MAKDAIKLSLNVLMIHFILIVIFSSIVLPFNPTNAQVDAELAGLEFYEAGDNGLPSDEESGICMHGATQEQCEDAGCQWSNGYCLNSIQTQGNVDLTVFDVFTQLFNIAEWIGKVVVFISKLFLFEIFLTFYLGELIGDAHPIWTTLLGLILVVFNVYVLYVIWGFVSNWRGQKTDD